MEQNQTTLDRKLLLIGGTGSGLSASGNTILGKPAFPSQRSSSSVTRSCQVDFTEEPNRIITVLDTPALFNTESVDPSVEIKKFLELISAEIHVILLVLRSQDKQAAEVLSLYKRMFGERAMKHTLVLFTHGDELQNPLDELIEENEAVSEFLKENGGRFHLLNNKDPDNRDQVASLLEKIDGMVGENQHCCYTSHMFKGQSWQINTTDVLALSLAIFVCVILSCVIIWNEGSSTLLSEFCKAVFSTVAGVGVKYLIALLWKRLSGSIGCCTQTQQKTAKYVLIFVAGFIIEHYCGPEKTLTLFLRGTQACPLHIYWDLKANRGRL